MLKELLYIAQNLVSFKKYGSVMWVSVIIVVIIILPFTIRGS
jgi:hypothetical protein